jgi:hypothetical protein
VHFTAAGSPPPPPPPSTATVPLVTIANDSIQINKHSDVDMGVSLSTTDSNDSVVLDIKGLPHYMSIADHLGHSFSGSDVTSRWPTSIPV